MPMPESTSSSAMQKRPASRLFRLASAIALIMAAVAVMLLLQGERDGRALALIATSLAIGLFVLIGYAAMAARQLKKDKDDTRS